MGIIIRQSIKSTIVSYIGIVIGTINILFLAPEFLRPDQLGLTRFLIESAVVFTSFAQLGIPHIVDKFLPHYRDEEQKHYGFFSFVMLYALAGFIFFLLLFFLIREPYILFYQKRSPLLIDYFYYIIPFTLFSVFVNITEAYSRGHSRIVVPTFVKEIFLKGANLVLIVLFGFSWISFDQLVIGLILSYAVAVLLLFYYLKSLGKFFMILPSNKISRRDFKDMAIFGLFIILGGLGSVLAAKIDILMLPAMTNLDLTGIYVIALFIGTVIEIPKRSVGQISTPIISQSFKENNHSKIEELYTKSSINLLLIGSLIFICIWANIDDLFSIIPNSEVFSKGKYVVFYIGLAKLIDISIGVNGEIILNSKYYRIILYYVLILAVLTIITNYIFIPLYGITGAAMAMALSIFVFTLIKLWFVYSKFKMQPFSSKTLVAVAIALGCFGISFLLPESQTTTIMSVLNIALKCTVVTCCFGILVYKLKISEDINSILIGLYHKYLVKK